MRERLKLKPERKRLRFSSYVIPATYDTRPKEYLDLRFWWLHELRQLRAKRRIAGASVKKDIKVAQKELARLRKEHC
jgi:hypothetical protein